MPTQYLLDASALLAVLKNERAAPDVEPLLKISYIHVFNLAEVMTKLIQIGSEDLLPALRQLDLKIVSAMSYDETEACARLHAGTRAQGLSLGDCVCLATAAARGWIAVTKESLWVKAAENRGIEVMVVPLKPEKLQFLRSFLSE